MIIISVFYLKYHTKMKQFVVIFAYTGKWEFDFEMGEF